MAARAGTHPLARWQGPAGTDGPTADGALPRPEGRRAVPVLFAEADGVWVRTQREPAHERGCELKCELKRASAYEGSQRQAGPTPGHPRPHYRLVAKRVSCHAFDHRDAAGHADRGGPQALPFWDGGSLALARTSDPGRVPLVAVGGAGGEV